MAVSVFDLFKIGIGPSSSHTVGPMRAAARFVEKWLVEGGSLEHTARATCELYGSLALTGRGHGTDKAVICGLEGEWPDRIDPDSIPQRLERIRKDKRLRLHGTHEIAFDEKTDLIFNKRQKLPYHVNGMRFTRVRRAGRSAGHARLLLGRRRLRGQPGRSFAGSYRRRHHAAAASVLQRRPVAGDMRARE